MEAGKNKFNKFGAGLAVIAVVSVGLIWYTNPELITSWFSKKPLDGRVEWREGSSPVIVIRNNSDLEWKDVKVTLNKKSVTQRYEYSVPSIKKHPQGFHIPADRFQKSNGEMYPPNAGAPHTVTVEVTLPDGKAGSLGVNLGGKKI